MFPRPNPQPVKGVLAIRNIKIRAAAEAMPGGSVSEHYLGRVLNGYIPPSERVRRGLSDLLDLPEDELFRRDDREAVAS